MVLLRIGLTPECLEFCRYITWRWRVRRPYTAPTFFPRASAPISFLLRQPKNRFIRAAEISCELIRGRHSATRQACGHLISIRFEFVLVESALSQLRPDPSSFASHFSSSSSEDVLTFPNLGGDAILVVPRPLSDHRCYTHLAQFLRDAPSSQVDALWRGAGLAMQDRISSTPIWLSTAGMGVSWLHLRLDSRPKYYRYEPYKAADA
jgi:hypothetical protein